jgi:hypothetical protein
MRSRTTSLLLVCLGLTGGALGATGCGDDDGAGVDAQGFPDAAVDAAVTTDSGPDAGPCLQQGALGADCTDDCGCQADLACRGLPGAQVCAVPCESYEVCETSLPGCTLPTCDLSLGACRCQCEIGGCGDDVCFAGFCVGCAVDPDCEAHACGSEPGLDRPVCRHDTGACDCGGACGDGVCDPAEAASLACPEDCTACAGPGLLAAYCSEGGAVPWCTCDGASWSCSDPFSACSGENRCQREGGQCVAEAEHCYDGTVDGSPLGCAGEAPLCCAPDPCTGAGDTYYPGNGRCCPGLRALASVSPMTGMDPEISGTVCFPGCWARICAPCGDGTCQLHLGENPCSCPEDCPAPPDGFACGAMGTAECGRPYCRMEGGVCREVTHRCEAGACAQDATNVPGAYCSPVTDGCVLP